MSNLKPDRPAVQERRGISPSLHQDESISGRSRNQIACESCRMHKQKCDGNLPCAKCSRRGSECVYREKMRPCRKRRAGRQIAAPAAPAREAVVLRHAVPGVRATQPISDSRFSELYYGPLSNFSIMQQLFLGLSHAKNQPQHVPSTRVQDVGEGLDEFQYRKVAFYSQLETPVGVNSSTLNLNDLQDYFDAYLHVAHFAFPIIPKEHLQSALAKIQDPDEPVLDSIDRAVLLAALSIGAIFCKAKDHGDNLVDAAQAIVDGSRGIINTQVIVVNYLIISRHNRAYLQLGIACRVAYAVGIHESTPDPSDTTAAAKYHQAIYCSLFVQECLMIPVLGRPTMLSMNDAMLPNPEQWPLLSTFVHLSKAFPLIQEMHHNHLTLGTVPKICDQLIQHLQDVATRTKESLGLDLNDDMQIKDLNLPYILLKLEYEQAVMLVHRPLLIMRAITMRFIQNKETRKAAQKLLSESTATLANHAVSSAKRLISVIDQVLTQTNYATCYTKMAFYIESACFVLILNSIGPQGSLTANSRHIEVAVGALAKLTNKKGILDIIVGIRTMLDRALVTTLAKMTTDDTGSWQSSYGSGHCSSKDSQQSEIGLTMQSHRTDDGHGSETDVTNSGNTGVNNSEQTSQSKGHLEDQDTLRDDTLSRINIALDWLATSYLS